MHKCHRITSVFSAILAVAILSGSASAQENRTVDGDPLGTPNWHAIAPGASELHGGRAAEAFAIQRNEFPDRTQESWRHPNNEKHGPLLTMFYERLHDSFFASNMFESDFESVFNSAFAARGVDISDARILTLDGNAKAAFISYASTRCVFVMRVFGPLSGREAISNGDRNLRVFVCEKRKADDDFLGDLAKAMLFTFTRNDDGRGVSARRPAQLQELIDRLFTPEEAA